MICLKCDAPTAHRLGAAEHEAAGASLCVQHLATYLRERNRWRCTSCERRLFAGPDRTCSWCQLGRPVSVDVTTTMVPVPIVRGVEERESGSMCPVCGATMSWVWRAYDDHVGCGKHAPPGHVHSVSASGKPCCPSQSQGEQKDG